MNTNMRKPTNTTAEMTTKLAVEIIGLLDGLPLGDARLVLDHVEYLINSQLHDIPIRAYANLDERWLRVGCISQK